MGNRSSTMVGNWYRDLAKKFIKKPQVFLPSLFFLYPSIAIFFLSASDAKPLDVQFTTYFLTFLSVKFNILLPVFLVSLATANLLKILVISLSVSG